ncbi:hypothetical protein Nepgr_014825 [Nepenthes gracilis]|uniref:Uncharacterized protein n=1 Tax=Nepenthes gracilis TaxID=150966 RepID=A0AAD3SLJ9_NEPGR|nr:hypothetical protein Nepgr_014825 [Nepenthes gracilis]
MNYQTRSRTQFSPTGEDETLTRVQKPTSALRFSKPETTKHLPGDCDSISEKKNTAINHWLIQNQMQTASMAQHSATIPSTSTSIMLVARTLQSEPSSNSKPRNQPVGSSAPKQKKRIQAPLPLRQLTPYFTSRETIGDLERLQAQHHEKASCPRTTNSTRL